MIFFSWKQLRKFTYTSSEADPKNTQDGNISE